MSTWMVVEDEPGIYEVLLAMFEMWGIDGVAFVDGEEAVAWIEDVDRAGWRGELPELALLDIRLPGKIQGPDVGERLRKSPLLKDMAIVLITAYTLTNAQKEQFIAQCQADRLLRKPLPKFSELKTLLEGILKERRSHTAPTLAASEASAPEAAPDTNGAAPKPSESAQETPKQEVPASHKPS